MVESTSRYVSNIHLKKNLLGCLHFGPDVKFEHELIGYVLHEALLVVAQANLSTQRQRWAFNNHKQKDAYNDAISPIGNHSQALFSTFNRLRIALDYIHRSAHVTRELSFY